MRMDTNIMAITVAVAAITEQSNVIIIRRGLRDTTAMTSVPIRVWLVVLLGYGLGAGSPIASGLSAGCRLIFG
jgi:hypothetical protein